LSDKCKYLSRLVESSGETFRFEFVQIEGKEDWGLLQTVFSEYIGIPILEALQRGRPIIKTGKTTVLNNMIAINIQKRKDENKITFTLLGSIYKNKIIPIREITKNVDYLQINDSMAMMLENITANRVGTVFAAWYVIDWLNGMPIEVNYDDYIISCANCAMNHENLVKYYRLYDLAVRNYIEEHEGCACSQKEFKKGDGCDKFFIRNTYPDLGEISEIIKDLF